VRLSDFVGGAPPVPFENIAASKELSMQLQNLLIDIGVLDPPANGCFGPVSTWALLETLKMVGLGDRTALDRQVATRLLKMWPDGPFALNPGDDFAGRIVRYMQAKRHWISRHPECLNIVYVEGCNLDGTPNDNAPGQFNDVRLVLHVTQPDGVPRIVKAWQGTTEPGQYYTQNPLHPGGAARIAFDQYKAWVVGPHGADAHEALVQVERIKVFRDKGRDYRRCCDKFEIGSGFGINQHWGYDLPENNIERANAGCLVGRTREGHREFMTAIKDDPRHRHGNAYRFMTAIMPVGALTP
jgi:hypothetical protein